MIIVDEQIHGERIRSAIAAWYSGQVESITSLRPNTVIKDDAIPTLLKQVRQPTFITINADDFWRRTPALLCRSCRPGSREDADRAAPAPAVSVVDLADDILSPLRPITPSLRHTQGTA